jgi:hypothetical protein
MKIALIWASVLLASILVFQEAGAIIVNIGGQQYEFPSHRVVQPLKYYTGRTDPHGPKLLSWTREEISAAIPNFVHEDDMVIYDFHVLVFPGFDGNAEFKKDSYLLRGDFSDEAADFDQATQLYKVRRRLDRDRWNLLSVPPNPSDVEVRSIIDKWVADCYIPSGFNHVLCSIETPYRGNNIHVNVLQQNVGFRNEIFAFIRREMDAAYRGMSPEKKPEPE